MDPCRLQHTSAAGSHVSDHWTPSCRARVDVDLEATGKQLGAESGVCACVHVHVHAHTRVHWGLPPAGQEGEVSVACGSIL